MRHIVFLVSILFAVISPVFAQDKPDPSTPWKVSGKLQHSSFAEQVKDSREAAAHIAATALELQDKNKKLETENAKLKASVPPRWKVVFAPMDWRKPGGDPCNPKAGCTLEGALPHTGWPATAQATALKVVTTTTPERSTITSGWKGWMTFGSKSPTIWLNATAAWGGQVHPAHKWAFEEGDVRYVVIRPFVCKNWGGWTEKVERPAVALGSPVEVKREPVATVTVPSVSDVMPLGVNPGNYVVCVDD